MVVKAVRAGTEDLVIRFERGVTIDGVVVDAQGQPATQGWVMANPAAEDGSGGAGSHGMIGPDGRFTIEGLRAGPYHLNAQSGDGGSVTLKVDAPARDLRLVLPARVKITGRLLGSGDRSGFRVTAYGAPQSGRRSPARRRGQDRRGRLLHDRRDGRRAVRARRDEARRRPVRPPRGRAARRRGPDAHARGRPRDRGHRGGARGRPPARRDLGDRGLRRQPFRAARGDRVGRRVPRAWAGAGEVQAPVRSPADRARRRWRWRPGRTATDSSSPARER